MTAQDQEDRPAPKLRSRKLYVLWAIALTLLISTALFCWLVVVPVMEVRRTVARCEGLELASFNIVTPGAVFSLRIQAVKELGGEAAAARKLSLYLRMPESVSDKPLQAVWLLRHCGKFGTRPLAFALSHPDEYVRADAAAMLGAIGHASECATSALLDALEDENVKVRREAIEALGRIHARSSRSEEIAGVLLKQLSQKDSDVRGAASLSLAEFTGMGPVAVEPVAALLKSSDWTDKSEAAKALGKMGQVHPEATRALTTALPHVDDQAKFVIAEALGKVHEDREAAISALEGLAAHKHLKVARYAIESLAEHGPLARRTVKAIVARSVLEQEWQHEVLYKTPGEAGYPGTHEAVAHNCCLTATFYALGSIGGKEAIAALENARYGLGPAYSKWRRAVEKALKKAKSSTKESQ